MKILICFLILIIFIQGILFWKFQRQVGDICRQLRFLLKNDSNMLVTGDTGFGGLKELMEVLNQLLMDRKKERKKYLEKEQMISDTYINLSHDIRTPLTSLDGYFQLLEQCDDREEQKHYMAIIQERIHSLKEMLEELFLFTKLKNDSFHLELKPCCINQVLKQTIFSYYDEWTGKGIQPEIRITDQLLYIEGNEAALHRMFQNVIKNALDHGAKGIGLSLEEKEGKSLIRIWNEVRDPEKIDPEKVFERFYKADEARSKTSSGLGLSIAKEFTDQMHGQIQARLEGKIFYIEIYFNTISAKPCQYREKSDT